MKGHRIPIPPVLRPQVLEILHAAHQGTARMASRAQASVFWPGASVDIDNVRRRCIDCLRMAPSQPHMPPATPMQAVAADYFYIQGKHYLVIVDRFSRWPHIVFQPSGAKDLFKALIAYFSTFGVSAELGQTDLVVWRPRIHCAGDCSFPGSLGRIRVRWRPRIHCAGDCSFPGSLGRMSSAFYCLQPWVQRGCWGGRKIHETALDFPHGCPRSPRHWGGGRWAITILQHPRSWQWTVSCTNHLWETYARPDACHAGGSRFHQ